MTTQKVSRDPVIIYEEQAQHLLDMVSDPVTRTLMEIANGEVRRRFEERHGLPVSDFDLLFFTEGMRAFFGKTDMLRRILAGDDLAAGFDVLQREPARLTRNAKITRQEDDRSPIINPTEASDLTESITDRTTWQLLAMANTDLLMNIAQGNRLPVARFDMLFFAQVMCAICERHEQLQAILWQRETA